MDVNPLMLISNQCLHTLVSENYCTSPLTGLNVKIISMVNDQFMSIGSKYHFITLLYYIQFIISSLF